MTTKWVFTDPTDSTTTQFEINPNTADSFPYKKNISSQTTVARDGRTLLFEGSSVVPEISFSGVILTQTQYNDMVTWFNKKHPIELTDDLGRTLTIYISEFTATRQRANNYPWKHTYSCRANVIDGL